MWGQPPSAVRSSEARLPSPATPANVDTTGIPRLLLHPHALPERHVSLYLLRRRLRLRIKPSRSGIPLASNFNIVITRRPLPRTHRVRLARPEIFLANCIRRKILIALNLYRLV